MMQEKYGDILKKWKEEEEEETLTNRCCYGMFYDIWYHLIAENRVHFKSFPPEKHEQINTKWSQTLWTEKRSFSRIPSNLINNIAEITWHGTIKNQQMETNEMLTPFHWWQKFARASGYHMVWITYFSFIIHEEKQCREGQIEKEKNEKRERKGTVRVWIILRKKQLLLCFPQYHNYARDNRKLNSRHGKSECSSDNKRKKVMHASK